MPIAAYRFFVLGLTALAVAAPLSLVIYQSFLTAPFFDSSAKFGLLAYSFVFADPEGYRITANQNPWDRFPLGGRSQS